MLMLACKDEWMDGWMAAQGPQQPRGLHIFLASFYFFGILR